MIKPPVIRSAADAQSNVQAIADLMDNMAIEMDTSAATIRNSAMSQVAGEAIARTASGMEERAAQIRVISTAFRVSGDMDRFDQACTLAGWRPDPRAIQAL